MEHYKKSTCYLLFIFLVLSFQKSGANDYDQSEPCPLDSETLLESQFDPAIYLKPLFFNPEDDTEFTVDEISIEGDIITFTNPRVNQAVINKYTFECVEFGQSLLRREICLRSEVVTYDTMLCRTMNLLPITQESPHFERFQPTSEHVSARQEPIFYHINNDSWEKHFTQAIPGTGRNFQFSRLARFSCQIEI